MLQILRFVPIAHAVNQEDALVFVHDRVVGNDSHERCHACPRRKQPQIAAARLQSRLNQHTVHFGIKKNCFTDLEVAQARTDRTALDAGNEEVQRVCTCFAGNRVAAPLRFVRRGHRDASKLTGDPLTTFRHGQFQMRDVVGNGLRVHNFGLANRHSATPQLGKKSLRLRKD